MVISSHIEGRLRVRDPRLRDARFLKILQEKLQQLQGVNHVCGNARSGSLLVLYRQAQASLEKINQLLASVLGGVAKNKARRRGEGGIKTPASTLPALPLVPSRRQVVNWGMLLSLLLSLGGLAVGSKQLHVVAGTVFVAVFGIHLIDKRKALVA